MKHEQINDTHWIVLSRRNLLTLLAKLDGNPPDSACTIRGGSDAWGYFVKAEEDDVHYATRADWPTPTRWGPMHPDTENAITTVRLCDALLATPHPEGGHLDYNGVCLDCGRQNNLGA